MINKIYGADFGGRTKETLGGVITAANRQNLPGIQRTIDHPTLFYHISSIAGSSNIYSYWVVLTRGMLMAAIVMVFLATKLREWLINTMRNLEGLFSTL